MTTENNQLITAMLLVLTFFNATHAIASEDSGKKIYVYTDKNGHSVFTDRAKPGAKLVDMSHNTLTMPATDTRIVTEVAKQNATPQYRVTINSPQHQQTIRSNEGLIEVSGTVNPSRLSFNHKYQLRLDGRIIQKPHANANFILRDVDRGEHTIVLELLNDNLKVIAKSDPVSFHLFRTSILHNRSQN